MVLAFVAFLLVLRLNLLTIGLSLIGGFMTASYPFLKRFTSLPQFYLGAAFGWSVPMAFAAQTGSVPVSAWLLFLAVLWWGPPTPPRSPHSIRSASSRISAAGTTQG